MKIILRCLIVGCVALIPGAVARAVISNDPIGTRPDYQPSEIIVKFKSDPALIQDALGGQAVTRWPDVNAIIRSEGLSAAQLVKAGQAGLTYLWRVPAPRDLNETITALQHSPHVAYAEPNLTVRAAFEPNDPYVNQQWNFSKVNAAAAWDYDTTEPLYGGDPSVVVAVLDTGVAYQSYTDPNVAACLDPIDGTPDCLAAGAVYAQAPDFEGTNFASGYDFVNDDSHPNDDNGHGTHVASTIAEATDNHLGAAGLAYQSTIMPVKVLARDGYGSSLMIAQGIDFALQNGTDVINMSLAMSGSSQLVDDVIAEAVGQGLVLVAAAGNDGASSISYPARSDSVVAVGASSNTSANSRSSFSNYGNGLDLLAPGGGGGSYVVQQSFSNWDENNLPAEFESFGYIGYQGTSMATPHVSAAAALLKAAGVSGSEIPAILNQSAADLGAAGYDLETGYGLLDIASAYQTITEDVSAPVSQATLTPVDPSGQNGYYVSRPTVSLSATDDRSGFASLRYHWDNESYIEYSGALYAPEGVHVLEYYATDAVGNIETAHQTTVKVDSTSPTIIFDQYRNGETASQRRLSITGSVSDDTSGVGSVTINGQTAALQGNRFSLTISLRPGLNTLTAIATDQAGLTGSASDTVRYNAVAKVLTAASGGVPAEVGVFDRTGLRQLSVTPWPAPFKIGANLTSGDVDGDGAAEIIIAPSQSGGPEVKIYSLTGTLLGRFMAYAASYRGGVNLASGDVDGDGTDEIITGTSTGRAAHIRVFNGRGQLENQFFAFPESFRLGINLASGDVDNDGQSEIVAAPVDSAGPHVRIFNGRGQLEGQFFAYPQTYRLGLNLTVADLDGNGVGEIITAPNHQATAHVRIFDRQGSVQGQFFAYPTFFRGGVSLAAGDVNADGFDEIITAPASSGGPQVRVFNGAGQAQNQFFVKDSAWRGGLSVASILVSD